MCDGGGGSGDGTDYGDIVSWVASMIQPMLDQRSTWENTHNPFEVPGAGHIFTARLAYDPDFYVDGMLAALNAFVATLVEFHTTGLDISSVASDTISFRTGLSAWSTISLWEAFIDAADTKLTAKLLDATAIDNVVDAHSTILQDDLENVAIARFEGGMRNINAVQASAFVIGEALLQAAKDKQVAKLDAELALDSWRVKNQGVIDFGKIGLLTDLEVLKSKSELMRSIMHFYCQGVEFKRLITNSIVEALRMIIVAKKEETDKQIEIDKGHALWSWELLEYVDHWITSAHGGAAMPSNAGVSPVTSAIGGAMSGAATGAMIGSVVPGLGTATGAIAGGIIGGLGGLLK